MCAACLTVFLVVADEQYGRAIPHAVLTKMQQQFAALSSAQKADASAIGCVTACGAACTVHSGHACCDGCRIRLIRSQWCFQTHMICRKKIKEVIREATATPDAFCNITRVQGQVGVPLLCFCQVNLVVQLGDQHVQGSCHRPIQPVYKFTVSGARHVSEDHHLRFCTQLCAQHR